MKHYSSNPLIMTSGYNTKTAEKIGYFWMIDWSLAKTHVKLSHHVKSLSSHTLPVVETYYHGLLCTRT